MIPSYGKVSVKCMPKPLWFSWNSSECAIKINCKISVVYRISVNRTFHSRNFNVIWNTILTRFFVFCFHLENQKLRKLVNINSCVPMLFIHQNFLNFAHKLHWPTAHLYCHFWMYVIIDSFLLNDEIALFSLYELLFTRTLIFYKTAV